MRQINTERARENCWKNNKKKKNNNEQQSKYKTLKNFHLGQSQIRIQETRSCSYRYRYSHSCRYIYSKLNYSCSACYISSGSQCATVAARSFRPALCVTLVMLLVLLLFLHKKYENMKIKTQMKRQYRASPKRNCKTSNSANK